MRKYSRLYPAIAWFAFLIILLWMTSCKSAKPVIVQEKVTEVITETPRDTTFTVPGDKSFYKASLGLINGEISITNVSEIKPGKTTLLAPKVSISKNQLTVDCESHAQEVLKQWKEKNSVKTTVIEKPIYIKYEMAFFEKFQIYAARLFFLILIILLIIWYVRKKITAFGFKSKNNE